MIRIRKLPYYLRSVAALVRNLENPGAAACVFAGRSPTLRFHSGMRLLVTKPLDLLIAKETLIDDEYRISNLRDPAFVIDCGASIGDFSIAVASRFPSCQVIAFEADPAPCTVLRENLILNGIRNVTVHAAPAGCGRGETALGPLILGEVALLKIDCEGHELPILESVGDDNFSRIRRIALEYHNYVVPKQDEKIRSFLVARGYSCEAKPDPYNKDLGYIHAVLS